MVLGKNVCYWGSEAHANELAARAKPEATDPPPSERIFAVRKSFL